MWTDGAKVEATVVIRKDELMRALCDMTINNDHFCLTDVRSWSIHDAERLESVAKLIRRLYAELEH